MRVTKTFYPLMVRLILLSSSAAIFLLSGCTASPSASGYSSSAPGSSTIGSATNSPSSSSSSSSSSLNSNGGVFDPFNPPGTGGDVVNLYVPGSSSSASSSVIVAWSEQRCASLGDSLPAWVSGPVAGYGEGRFEWAQAYIHSQVVNGATVNYDYYYSVARQARDAYNKPVPIYPSFESFDSSNNPIALSATDPMEPSDPASTKQTLSPGHRLGAFCIASCYRGNVPLYFASDAGRAVVDPESDATPHAIADAKARYEAGDLSFASVVTLAPGAVLGALNMLTSAIESFTQDISIANPAPQAFFTIKTAQGHSIQVTHNHTLVTRGGLLRTAEDIAGSLEAGNAEYLLTGLSTEEQIVEASSQNLQELSYNVTVHTTAQNDAFGDVRQHLVVSGDGKFLSGDKIAQNNLQQIADLLNREMDRENMEDPGR